MSAEATWRKCGRCDGVGPTDELGFCSSCADALRRDGAVGTRAIRDPLELTRAWGNPAGPTDGRGRHEAQEARSSTGVRKDVGSPTQSRIRCPKCKGDGDVFVPLEMHTDATGTRETKGYNAVCWTCDGTGEIEE